MVFVCFYLRFHCCDVGLVAHKLSHQHLVGFFRIFQLKGSGESFGGEIVDDFLELFDGFIDLSLDKGDIFGLLRLETQSFLCGGNFIFASLEEEKQLTEVIEEMLPKLSILDDGRLIDLLLFFMGLSLDLYLPLIGSFPRLEFFVFGYIIEFLFFCWVFGYFEKFISICNEVGKSIESIFCVVFLVGLVVILQVFLYILFFY